MSARGMLEEKNSTDGVSNVSSIGADKTRLDLDADDEWEARWARLQRIAWIIMGIVLLLAITGVFGWGPVDHATAADNGNQFRVDYAPVILFRTPAVLTLHLSPSLAGSDHLVHVQASKALLAPLQIQRVDRNRRNGGSALAVRKWLFASHRRPEIER